MNTAGTKNAKQHSRGLIVLVTMIAVGGLGIVARVRSEAALESETHDVEIPLVKTVHAVRGGAGGELTLPGEVRAYVDAPVYARATGYVKRWFVDIGAEVKAGRLLAELDTPEVDAQLRQAEADLSSAEASLSLAMKTSARWTELVAIQAVSHQEYEDKAADLEVKQSSRDAAQENVYHYRQLQGFKRVVAPFDGVITARNVDIGDLVQAGTGTAGAGSKELFHLVDASKLRVYIDVPQSRSGALTPGSEARVIFPENPGKRYLGSVVRTAGAIAPDTRTLRVEVEVENARRALLGGSYAEVTFSLPAADTLRLPINSILFRGDGLTVASVDVGGLIRLVPVQLGRDFGTEVEVLDGLSGTEAIALNPPDGIRDGDLVRVKAGG
jgi:RND family efflux transporter MFP subunit